MICDLAPKVESSSSSSQDTGVLHMKGTARVKTKREAVPGWHGDGSWSFGVQAEMGALVQEVGLGSY